MFDVVINGVDSDAELARLSEQIQVAINAVTGVASCEEVDQQIEDDSVE